MIEIDEYIKLLKKIISLIDFDKIKFSYQRKHLFRETNKKEIQPGIFTYNYGASETSNLIYLIEDYFRNFSNFKSTIEYQSLVVLLSERYQSDSTKVESILDHFILKSIKNIDGISISKNVNEHFTSIINHLLSKKSDDDFKVLFPIFGMNSDRKRISLNENASIIFLSFNERCALANKDTNDSIYSKFTLLENPYYLLFKYKGVDQNTFQFKSSELLNKVIVFCRIFQEGNITNKFGYYYYRNWEFEEYTVLANYISNDNSDASKNSYFITKNNILLFKRDWKIFDSVDFKKNKLLNIIVKRFDYSFLSNDYENKLIDLMIAFEAFFLKESENDELKYRLSLRVAHYFQSPKYSKKFVFNFIKKAYDLRSYAMHGLTKNKDVIKLSNKQFS